MAPINVSGIEMISCRETLNGLFTVTLSRQAWEETKADKIHEGHIFEKALALVGFTGRLFPCACQAKAAVDSSGLCC